MSKLQLKGTTLITGVSLAIVSVISLGCSVTREPGCCRPPARCIGIANWKHTAPLGRPSEVSGLLASRSRTVVEQPAANPIHQVSSHGSSIQNEATQPTQGAVETENLVGQINRNSILLRVASIQQKVTSEKGEDAATKTAPLVAEKRSSAAKSAQLTIADRSGDTVPPTLIADPESLLGINGEPQKLIAASRHEADEKLQSPSQPITQSTDDLSSRREHGLENAVATNKQQKLAQTDSRSKNFVPATNRNIDGGIMPDPLSTAGGEERISKLKYTLQQPVDQQLASSLPGREPLGSDGEVGLDGSISETLVVIESEVLAISDLPGQAERLLASSVSPNPSHSSVVAEVDQFTEVYYDPTPDARPLEMQLRDRGWNREFTVNRAARAYQIFDYQRIAELAERREMAELAGQSVVASSPLENSRESRTVSGNTFQASHARPHLGGDAHQRQYAVPATEGELGNLMLGFAPMVPPQPTRLSLQAVPDNKTTWVPPLIRLDRPAENQGEHRSPATPPSPPSQQADPPQNIDWFSPLNESVPRWNPPQIDSAERFTERVIEREQKK